MLIPGAGTLGLFLFIIGLVVGVAVLIILIDRGHI